MYNKLLHQASIYEIRASLNSESSKKKDKERVDKDVRPTFFTKNYDSSEPGLGTSPYRGNMDRFKSIKDFLDKSRKSRKKKKKELDIYAAIKLADDFEDAVEHAIAIEDATYTGKACYVQTYSGMKPLNDIVRNYDDVGSWSEWAPGELKGLNGDELINTISGFRGAGWARRALDWLQGSMPPIVLVETKDAGNVIGDGRGRVSLAIGLNLKSLPAIVLKEDTSGNKCFDFENGRIVTSKSLSLQPKIAQTEFEVGDWVTFDKSSLLWKIKMKTNVTGSDEQWYRIAPYDPFFKSVGNIVVTMDGEPLDLRKGVPVKPGYPIFQAGDVDRNKTMKQMFGEAPQGGANIPPNVLFMKGMSLPASSLSPADPPEGHEKFAGDVVELFKDSPKHISPDCLFCPEEGVKLVYRKDEDLWVCPKCLYEYEDVPHEEGAGVFKTEELDPFTRKRMEQDE